MKRLIVAVIFIPLFYLYVMKLEEGYFFALLSIVALLSLYEFYRMARLGTGLTVIGLFLGILILNRAYKGFSSTVTKDQPFLFFSDLFSTFVFSFILIALYRLISRRDPSMSMRDTGITLLGLFYIIGLMSFQLGLRHLGPEWIIYLYGTIWLCDSSAYYVGTYLGKRRLYPEVSPKKTVEGAIASVIGGVIGSIILGLILKPPGLFSGPQRSDLLILGIIIGGLSVAGDLVESMYKRDAGVKDSSRLIPGHGGVLDKIDSTLVVAPFVYWYLYMR